MIQEILYGHSHSKRNNRCFIFVLEDKTIESDICNDELGIDTGRLYGICVIHPRILKVPATPSTISAAVLTTETAESTETPLSPPEWLEFESTVCYAFITRFPLLEFFFQVIFDIITTERLTRMELAAVQPPNLCVSSSLHCNDSYDYLPTAILNEMLERLIRVPPPKYSEPIRFQLSSSIMPIEKTRLLPPATLSEHYANAADWALPTLLSWIPVETLIWTVSLLMSDVKIIVTGSEYGMVSCAVMGLLILLRPLDWVAPLIPMLPYKLLDFIESPVPILAGLVINPNTAVGKQKELNVQSLLERCG